VVDEDLGGTAGNANILISRLESPSPNPSKLLNAVKPK
jgi:hypothetical protein